MENKGFEGDATVVDYENIVRNRKPVPLKPYPGMNKEDLLKFSQTPFWNRLRMISMILFWVCWIGLFVTVVAITIAEDRCDDFPSPPWWQSGSMYQVYVRSYKDSNGDGFGDLQGIQSELSHIQTLQANSIVLSSFYASHDGGDYGYDVIDHQAIDPEAGNLDDFENLLNDAHDKGLHVIVEFIPNHTGEEHPWFIASADAASHLDEYWNYYIWADGQNNNNEPPNNWLTVYDEPAWTKHPTRNQWYFHNYLPTQPELNLRSTAVQNHMEEILRFWLDLGVDGIQVNSASLLMESTDLKDEEPASCTTYGCLNHQYTRNQPENIDIIAKWRRIVDEYPNRILIADVHSTSKSNDNIDDVVRYYGYNSDDAAHLVLNYGLTELPSNYDTDYLVTIIDNWLRALPHSVVSTWMTSNHDLPRMVGTTNNDDLNILNDMLLATLPGASYIYYGDEIGMKDGNPGDPVDPVEPNFNRDAFRSPMQWNDQKHSGFMNNESLSDPWLPINGDYVERNVYLQNQDSLSIARKCRDLLRMKQAEGSLRFGEFHFATTSGPTLSYIREWEGHNRIMTILNFSDDDSTQNYRDAHWMVPDDAVVEMISNGRVGYSQGDEISTDDIAIPSHSGIIISWEYKR